MFVLEQSHHRQSSNSQNDLQRNRVRLNVQYYPDNQKASHPSEAINTKKKPSTFVSVGRLTLASKNFVLAVLASHLKHGSATFVKFLLNFLLCPYCKFLYSYSREEIISKKIFLLIKNCENHFKASNYL